jgi:hypothetical protein
MSTYMASSGSLRVSDNITVEMALNSLLAAGLSHDFVSEGNLYFAQPSLAIFTMMCLTEARYELINHFCLNISQL